MAKKKSKKKEGKKKDIKKKKGIKPKPKKQKESKKKGGKKKDSKKKDSKKKESKKKESKKKAAITKGPVAAPGGAAGKIQTAVPPTSATPKTPVIKKEDHSSNYKVADAIKKLRALKSREALLSFIKNEKRVTITRVIPAAMNRLKK